MTADEAVKARSPLGVSEHDMTPGWRVIVARRPDGQARTFYHSTSDDLRHIDALRRHASDWARPSDKDRQLVELRAKAPLRSKGKPVEDAGHLPLFVAGNEPGLFA